MIFEELAKKEINGIIDKINSNMELYTGKTPHISDTGRYSDKMSEDGSWTGSFWMGMVIIAAVLTQNVCKYEKYLAGFKDFYTKRLKYGYKDHDLGFLYQLYAMDAYRLTCDTDYLDMADRAARCLYSRYNPRGGYIRAWGPLAYPGNDGKLIMDCMMNLPLLFCTAKSGGDERYYSAAYSHARAALNCIREDGSVYHTYDFNVLTGEPVKGENEGGYADGSCWARGLAWTIYGYYLAWVHTGDKQFLDVCKKTSDCFIKNTPKGCMPRWDFYLDNENDTNIDTSAAAIAACGMYGLSRAVDDNSYINYANDMLCEIIHSHSHVFDKDWEALIDCGMTATNANGVKTVHQQATIWGDYFYFEALALSICPGLRMWDI